jgi:hypothetical protein
MVGYGDLVKVRNGFKLHRTVRTTIDAKYGTHHSVVQVSKLLADLVGRCPTWPNRTSWPRR